MKKNWMWMLLLPIAAKPLIALAAGTLTYGPVGTGGAAHAIPIPSLLLLPLGIILAIVGLRQLSRNRAQQILGLLLTVGGTVTAVSSGVYIQETTASPATTELSEQQGGSVAVPIGPQDYRNTSGITLEIRSVNAPETYCVSDNPISECLAGNTLENGAICQTSFTCVSPVPAQAIDDMAAITNGGNVQINVLDNDLGTPISVLSFGSSGATVGSFSPDGTTVLSLPVAGGTLDVTMTSSGVFSALANGTSGASTVAVYYEMASANGSSDIGMVSVQIGDLPSAVDDTPATLGSGNEYATDVGVTLNIGAGVGLLNNDTLGTPAASLSQWGGGDASVSADLIPNTSSPFAGGTITVYSDGSFDLVNPTVPGTYTFDYQIQNSIGSSTGTVAVEVLSP